MAAPEWVWNSFVQVTRRPKINSCFLLERHPIVILSIIPNGASGRHVIPPPRSLPWSIWPLARPCISRPKRDHPLLRLWPELCPTENVWRFLRDNYSSNRVLKACDDIVDHCRGAGNKPVNRPWRIISIGRRDWAQGFRSTRIGVTYLSPTTFAACAAPPIRTPSPMTAPAEVAVRVAAG